MASTTQTNSQVSGWISEQWNWLRELPKATVAHQLILVTTAVVAIVFDQQTKWWVEANILLKSSWAPFPTVSHLFDFTHVPNEGAAFGSFPQLSWLFSILPFIVSGFILFYNKVILGRHPAFRIALGLIMGGALGNVIDRFRLGWVTDFIHFDFRPLASEWLVERIHLLNFAIFNLADLFIFSGVIIMFVLMWKDTLPDDPWTELEDKEPSQAFKDWQQVNIAADPAAGYINTTDTIAHAPSITNTHQYHSASISSTNSTTLNWRGEPADKKERGSNGRFGLKVAVAIGIIGLIVTFFVIRKRRKRN